MVVRLWFFYFHYSCFLNILWLSTIRKSFSPPLYLFNLCVLMGSYVNSITTHWISLFILIFKLPHFLANGNPFQVTSVSFWQATIILFALPYCGEVNNGPPKMSTPYPLNHLNYLDGPNVIRKILMWGRGRRVKQRGEVKAEAESQNYMNMPRCSWKWRKVS